MNEKRKIELLSPAKNLECGVAAITCGADAVYIGSPKFSARFAAGNSVEDVQRLCDFAHLYGAKVYVALNTILTEYLSELGKYLFDIDMNFISLYNTINNIVSEANTFELFSIDGIIRSLISFGFISLLISYILRFIFCLVKS